MSNAANPFEIWNAQASDWMHRGIALLERTDPASLEEAVRCFDEAIALRRTLPLKENFWYRYVLSAGWMNRGDALARLGGTEQLVESLKSYELALALLVTLPLEENPQYPRRLAIAWLNRGHALQKQETLPATQEAIHSFRESLAVLEKVSLASLPDHYLLRAGAWTNLASALLEEESVSEARTAAQTALALVKDSEGPFLAAAEAGLKARYLLCQMISRSSLDGKTLPKEALAEATDLVDEALALIRHWESGGETGFAFLAQNFFTLGCRLYRVHQPHFLVEFILETLDPTKTGSVPSLNPEMHETAADAVWHTLQDIQREGFHAVATPDFEQLLSRLRELRVAQARLEQLRSADLLLSSGLPAPS